MNFVIDAELCVACLACVRVCPTDAIAVSAEEPLLVQIEDEPCIRCGQCLQVCPHGAVKVNGEIGRALAIAAQGEGVLILSPESVAHFYPATPEQLINACYAAGFRAVTRGVIGDELVARALVHLARRAELRHRAQAVDRHARPDEVVVGGRSGEGGRAERAPHVHLLGRLTDARLAFVLPCAMRYSSRLERRVSSVSEVRSRYARIET